MKRIAFLVLSTVFFVTSAHAQVETSTPEALLEKMARTYAALKSYQDTTIAHFRNPDGSAGAQAECKIWFSRPNYLRIDGHSRRAPDAPPRRDVIWADGNSARSWSTGRAVTLLDRIQLAGSKMFGTYAYHVPTLIDQSYGGAKRLNDLGSPQLAGEENVEGVDCARVRGDWHGDAYEVWIGKDDSLVRKVTANYKGYVMEESHRDIVVDQPVAAAVFQFAPEKEAVPPPVARSSPAPSPSPSTSPAKQRKR